MSRIRASIIVAVLAAILMVPATAEATVIDLSVEQMSAIADTVVEVHVTAADTRWSYDAVTHTRQSIVTDVRLVVTRVLKGRSSYSRVLTLPGGSVGDVMFEVSDTPRFSPGERCILFLDERGVIGGLQGKLAVVDGEVPELRMTLAQTEALVRDSAEVSISLESALDAQYLLPAAGASISGVSPSAVDAGVGDVLTITGSGFGASQGSGTVTFPRGNSSTGTPRIPATVTSWSDGMIVCVVPRLAESGSVEVTTDGGGTASYTVKVGFSDSGMVWASPTVAYRVNENTSDMSGEGAAIQAAFDTWTAAGAEFSITYAGTCATTVYPAIYNGSNDIYFATSASFPTGVLATNSYWYNPSYPTVKLESDIVFNDSFTWVNGKVTGRFDVETVALHELGHTVGLDDQYSDMEEAMGAGAANSMRRVLSSYDVDGAIYIWGPSTATDTTPPDAPDINSSTHPSQTTWYADPDPAFAFSASDPSGVDGYSYVFDAAAGTDPDEVSEGTAVTKSYSGIADGEWYFHVRAVDGAGNWSDTAHYRVRIDTSVPLTVVEVAGVSRYETAVEASKLAYPAGASTVVIATGRNWPDALGGAALAGVVDGPILLSDTNAVPDSVLKELTRLGATHAIILGGTGALGDGVEADLVGAGLSVERIAGASRYDTAKLVAEEVIDRSGSYDGTALVATGAGFADALSASPMAAANGWPVFLADPKGSPSALVSAMKSAGASDVVVLGGTGAISAAYYDALADGFDSATRLYGATRYDTCAAVAQYAVDHAGLSYGSVAIGIGTNFPDALAGGPLCARNGGVMLLTSPTALEAATAGVLQAHEAEVSKVYFLGGPAAVSPAVRDEVTALLE